MSQVKKTKKLASVNENSVLPPEPALALGTGGPPKQRKSRAKPKPTKEEAIKLLQDASTDIKQIIQDLKEDEQRLASMQLKNVHELIKETLLNLGEDLEEIEEQLEQIRSQSDSQ
jgi:DNA repair exonuclease SbcCD ATPase subunit